MNATPGVVLVAVLALACSGDGGTGSCGSGGSATSVSVCDRFFAPSASPITPSATVTCTWRGAEGHNVTFEDGQGPSATEVSGMHSRTFSGAGTFRYRCTIHSSTFDAGMVGSVTVQ
jgi:plastocyanin